MVAERGTRPPLERILERICKQIVDVHVLQVVGQVTGVPKAPSRDRILQCMVEQIFDVLRAGDSETVDGSAQDYFPRQNPATDYGTYTSLTHQFRRL